jgi:hypothetical protein
MKNYLYFKSNSNVWIQASLSTLGKKRGDACMSQADKSEIRVECYAGYRGEEAPARFYLGERLVEVEEVLDRWIDPTHRYFKVKGDDGGIYILRHDTKLDVWEMTLFDSGKRLDARLSST